MRVLNFQRWKVVQDFLLYEKSFWRRMINDYPDEAETFLKQYENLNQVEHAFHDGCDVLLLDYIDDQTERGFDNGIFTTRAEMVCLNAWVSRPEVEEKVNDVLRVLNEEPYYDVQTIKKFKTGSCA